jgi:hypothetical protein
MKRTALYAVISLVLVVVGGWLFTIVYPGVDARRAIVTSAGVAYVVQLGAFVLARSTAGTNPFAGYGLGVLLRFVTLGLYALVFVPRLALPSMPALVSLATFFFVSTLVEPPLLKP